jgi:hypothetical protein
MNVIPRGTARKVRPAPVKGESAYGYLLIFRIKGTTECDGSAHLFGCR